METSQRLLEDRIMGYSQRMRGLQFLSAPLCATQSTAGVVKEEPLAWPLKSPDLHAARFLCAGCHKEHSAWSEGANKRIYNCTWVFV
jgi:hypothetical protein